MNFTKSILDESSALIAEHSDAKVDNDELGIQVKDLGFHKESFKKHFKLISLLLIVIESLELTKDDFSDIVDCINKIIDKKATIRL